MKYFKVMILSCIMLFVSTTQAAVSNCNNDNYFKNQTILFQPFAPIDVVELCHQEYNIVYSPEYKIPLIAGEHITSAELESASRLDRDSGFQVDPKIDPKVQASPDDYYDSGYDRGHNAPNADMPTMTAQVESFYMTNIVPQVPSNNRGIWRSIETEVRENTSTYGEAFVLTGSIVNKDSKIMYNGIRVPDYMYKSVYYPKTGDSLIYLVTNKDYCGECYTSTVRISGSEFKDKFGFDPTITALK